MILDAGRRLNVDKDISVAVVIPMYNSRESIVQVLSSIEHQSAVSCIKVVIVVNDGSTDDSLAVVKEYSSASSLVIDIADKENGGVSSARNAGFELLLDKYPEIEWVCLCDSDDLWHEDKLEKQLSVIDADPSIDCLGSQFNSSRLKINGKEVKELVKGSVRDILIQNFPQPSTVIMKTKIVRQMGGFDQSQRYAEDGNYFLRVAHDYNLYYLPECLIDYGAGKRAFGSSGLSANLKGMHQGNIKNLKDMKALGYISSMFYCEMRIYYFLKYIRRIIITITS